MKKPVSIGAVPWSSDDLLGALEEFAAIYERRPIRENEGGMRSPHAFLAWFVLKTLAPDVIIESGVWLGQGTWILEEACPSAELHCIEPNLSRITYRSRKAKYYSRDFTQIDWTALPRDRTVIFFDDHQNAYERLQTCRWFGFKELLFEDNYPPGRGDCYSLKKAFMHAGHRSSNSAQSLLSLPRRIAKLATGTEGVRQTEVAPNGVDEKYLRENLDIYRELPPVYRADQTRWGDPWTDDNYPTPKPLLTSVAQPFQEPFFEERLNYTWMCYARLH